MESLIVRDNFIEITEGKIHYNKSRDSPATALDWAGAPELTTGNGIWEICSQFCEQEKTSSNMSTNDVTTDL